MVASAALVRSAETGVMTALGGGELVRNDLWVYKCRKKRGVLGTLCANAGYGGGGALLVHL